MKVLVTGAAGLLGRYLVKRLLERNDDVIAVDALSRYRMFGDVDRRQPIPTELRHPRCLFVESSFDDPDVFSLMSEDGVEAVVHAAAQTSHPRSIDIPMLDFEVNALGTLRLLDFLRMTNSRARLVYVGSAKVYGENVTHGWYPFRENDKRILAPNWTFCGVGPDVPETWPIGDQTILTPFGVSKLAADLYCQQFAKLYGLDICVLRPGCFTGSGSLAVEEQNFLPPLVRAMVNGDTYPVYGYRGKQVRSVLHADCLARAILACLDRHDRWGGEVFNVDGGPENTLSILEAVDMVAELTGRRGELIFEEKRPGDWAWYCGSYATIKEALGWKPEIGVRETVAELCREAVEASRVVA